MWWVLPVLVVGLSLAAVARRLSRRTAAAETGGGTEANGGAAPKD